MGMVGRRKGRVQKGDGGNNGREVEGKGVGETWEEMKGKIQGILEGGQKVKEEKNRRRGWWDEECREGKEKVRGELRRWRKGRGDGNRYREEKLRYRKMIEKKKRKKMKGGKRR